MYGNEAWTLSKHVALREGKFILAPPPREICHACSVLIWCGFTSTMTKTRFRSASMCESNERFNPSLYPPPPKKIIKLSPWIS